MTVKDTVNFVVLSVNDLSEKTEESISMLQNAFFYNKLRFIEDARALTESIREKKDLLTAELEEAAHDSPNLKVYISIPRHLERISDHIDKIAGNMASKINEKILFSDKAMSEVTFLLQRTKEILNTMTDFILARNTFIAIYLKESQQEIERSATKFSTLHEDRLIEGLCTDKASGIFLNILSSIKVIAWHTRQIAEELVTPVT
ncbi:MAG: PhoU domain-containing protein [Thermodesulfovibrionales bacterium]